MDDYRGGSPRVNLTKSRQPASPPQSRATPTPPGPEKPSTPGSAGPLHGSGGRGPSGRRRGLWVLAGALAFILIGGLATAARLVSGDHSVAAPSSSSSVGSGADTTEQDGEDAPVAPTDESTTGAAGEDPALVDADTEAADELDSVVASDSAAASALEGLWTAQLASSAPGESPAQFLSKYHDLAAQYPGALLIWSGDWAGSFGPSSRESWVVLSGEGYDATRPLLEWCASEGWSPGQCWAKRLATFGDDPLLNTDRFPADDRNN